MHIDWAGETEKKGKMWMQFRANMICIFISVDGWFVVTWSQKQFYISKSATI